MRVVSAHQLGFPPVLRLPGPTGLALLFPLACSSSRVNTWHLAGGSIGKPWCWGRISVLGGWTVNHNKTYYMLFTNKPIKKLPPLFLHYDIIKKVTTHTLLGIIFDDWLSFKPHISHFCLKLSRVISLLYYVKDLVPLSIHKMMYHDAHVLPILNYCMLIWCNTYPTHLLPLFRLQKKIIRSINNRDYYEHTKPLFKNTNILTLFNLNKLHIGIHMFKTLNGHIQVLQPNHNYPTRSYQNLNVPLHTISLYQHSLSYTGPKLWNTIPQHIKTQPILTSFKNCFKKYILSLQ